MAEVALAMKKRVPYTIDEMVQLTGKDKDDLIRILGDMSWAGLVEYNNDGEGGQRR